MRNTARLNWLARIPSPMAGLALGIASLGWCFENAFALDGWGRIAGAVIAGFLLSGLTAKFICHPKVLLDELKHPVTGSVLPTFTMTWMIISYSISRLWFDLGEIIWLTAICIQAVFVFTFVYRRIKNFKIEHLIPSWFVPAVGICVADVAFPGGKFLWLADIFVWIGFISCLIMFPLMFYRLIFHDTLPDPTKPTLAILAAPASLTLTAYLSVDDTPSLLICAVLLGLALMMTAVIYLSFIRLMRLSFSPAYAAFTFPMVIGATALYKLANAVQNFLDSEEYLASVADYVEELRILADCELIIAAIVVAYVSFRYFHNYFLKREAKTV